LIAGGNMLAGVIVARWLGADSLGVLASLAVITLIAVTFGGFGLPSAITFLVARDKEKLKPAVTNGVVFALVTGGVIALSIVGLAATMPGLFGSVPTSLVTITALAIPFHLLSLFCLSAFLGLGDIGRYNLLDMVSQVFLVINPLVALGLLGMGLFVLVTMNAVTAGILSLVVLVLLFQRARAQAGQEMHFDFPLMTEMLGLGSKFYIAMAAGAIILRSDLLIVNYFRGSADAGVYAVATQVGTLLLLIPNVISTVLFPKVTEARDADGTMTCRVTRHAAFIMLIVCLAVVPLAFLLPILYGAAFASVPVLVLILLPGVYLLGVETVQVQYFNSLGLPRAVPVFWVGTMVVNVTLGLVFIPYFGAIAAAAVSSGSYAALFLMVSIYFRSATGRSFSEAFMLRREEFQELLTTGKFLVGAGEGKV